MDDATEGPSADRERRDGWGAARRPAAVALVAVTAALTCLAVPAAPRPAGAGGADWLYPARDRYEPGQVVTVIGYGYGDVADYRDEARAHGPFHGYLRLQTQPWPGTLVTEDGVTIEAAEGQPAWHATRVSVTFRLAADLEAGVYALAICNDGCTRTLGVFEAPSLYVGVDPPEPVVRDWPLTEPAIRWLEADALLVDEYGRRLTAAEVRAGRLPPTPDGVTLAAPEPPAAPPASDPAPADPAPTAPAVRAAGEPTAAEESATASPYGDRPATAWVIGAAAVLAATGALLWRRVGHASGAGRIRIRTGDPAAEQTPGDDPPLLPDGRTDTQPARVRL
jgi:hypothetical protein